MNHVPALVAAALTLVSSAIWAEGTPAAVEPSPIGTTIVGEQESAVGLYLMPWQEESADESDRPPSLVEQPLSAIDDRSFDANVQTQETIAAFRRSGLPRN